MINNNCYHSPYSMADSVFQGAGGYKSAEFHRLENRGLLCTRGRGCDDVLLSVLLLFCKKQNLKITSKQFQFFTYLKRILPHMYIPPSAI